MATNNNIFVIDDGTKPITLQNQYGQEIATLYIRISDIGIVDRYRDMAKDLEKAIIPLKDIALNNDGTATFEKDWALLKQVEQEIIDRINALFDITNAVDIFRTRKGVEPNAGRKQTVPGASGRHVPDGAGPDHPALPGGAPGVGGKLRRALSRDDGLLPFRISSFIPFPSSLLSILRFISSVMCGTTCMVLPR